MALGNYAVYTFALWFIAALKIYHRTSFSQSTTLGPFEFSLTAWAALWPFWRLEGKIWRYRSINVNKSQNVASKFNNKIVEGLGILISAMTLQNKYQSFSSALLAQQVGLFMKAQIAFMNGPTCWASKAVLKQLTGKEHMPLPASCFSPSWRLNWGMIFPSASSP